MEIKIIFTINLRMILRCTAEFHYVRWAMENQVSYHKADHGHEPEIDKESHFTLGDLNYDKSLVQIQINYDWCSPSSSTMITKFWSVLN